MKNILRIAIVIALFAGGKVIYDHYVSQHARVTQERVVAYVDSVDIDMNTIDKDVSSVVLNSSAFSPEEEGDKEIKTTLEEIKAAKNRIEKIKVPEDEDDFNNLKISALAQLAFYSESVSGTLGNIVHKLRPEEELHTINEMKTDLTGNISMNESSFNDSIENIISDLKTGFDAKKLDGMIRYTNAKQALYTKYNITRVRMPVQ